MKLPDCDDKDLAMVIMGSTAIIGIISLYFKVDPLPIITHLFTAIGSLAVGKKIGEGKQP